MPWWGWSLVALVVAGSMAVAFRDQLRYLIRVTKALATDERLPRPMRWALKLALAMKVIPLPDFGIDEVILVVVGLLLITFYRSTFRAILAESRRLPQDPKSDVPGPLGVGRPVDIGGGQDL